MNTVRIFIASSAELLQDRKDFREFLSIENDHLHKKGVYLELVQWENFLDTVSQTRLQDEYNKELENSSIVVCLFYTKAGKYTQEEFDTALKHFKEHNSPLIYTYFKAPAPPADDNDAQAKELENFKARLRQIGHFHTNYNNIDDLKNQLDMKRLRMHSSATVDGRLFVQFIALIYMSALRKEMRQSGLIKRYTARELLQEMDTLTKIKYSGKYGHILTEITKSQREILEGFKITLPLQT